MKKPTKRLYHWFRRVAHLAKTTHRKGDELTEDERAMVFLGNPACPDCGGGLLWGPEGAGSVNFGCADSKTCGSRFNSCMPFFIERVSDRAPAA